MTVSGASSPVDLLACSQGFDLERKRADEMFRAHRSGAFISLISQWLMLNRVNIAMNLSLACNCARSRARRRYATGHL